MSQEVEVLKFWVGQNCEKEVEILTFISKYFLLSQNFDFKWLRKKNWTNRVASALERLITVQGVMWGDQSDSIDLYITCSWLWTLNPVGWCFFAPNQKHSWENSNSDYSDCAFMVSWGMKNCTNSGYLKFKLTDRQWKLSSLWISFRQLWFSFSQEPVKQNQSFWGLVHLRPTLRSEWAVFFRLGWDLQIHYWGVIRVRKVIMRWWWQTPCLEPNSLSCRSVHSRPVMSCHF